MISRFTLALVVFGSVAVQAAPKVIKSYAISLRGSPKYPAGFQHVAYADPNATKGGQIVLSSTGGFDSLNPFTLKGNPAPGLDQMTDTITTSFADDPLTEYCTICESLEYPADRSSITYHLNPKATFQDGSAITAEDLAFSLAALTKNLPQYRAYYADVKPAVVVDPQTVRFEFKKANNELVTIMGQLPVLSKKYWSDKDLTKTTLDAPVGSGPYKVKSAEPGRSVTYELNPNYWAKDLPTRRGFYNFATIRYDNYGDEDVALEAFKGGAFDFRQEASSKNWNKGYECEGKRTGQMQMEVVANNSPQGMQGFAYNIRRPIFKDVRVREALSLLFDFEWMNTNLFYNAYVRSQSYFENSPFAARGLPTGAELKILEKYKSALPPEVFTKPFAVAKNKTEEERKANLRRALQLLEQAGWKFSGGGLKNAAGQPFQFEFLMTASPSMERVVLAYQQSLAKAGIKLNVRTVDQAQAVNRERDFDFDMISARQGESDSPGNEQMLYWGSAAAKQKGSRNLIGVENPTVDAILETLLQAKDEASLTANVRALDRVLVWNHYVIFNWHFASERIAFWNKFGKPAKNPPRGMNFFTWWLDAKKEAALKKARG